MRFLIYQYFDKPININKENYWDYSIQSIKKYAEKIHCEYRFISGGAPFHPHYGTLIPFLDGRYEDFDALIYIDCDVLATIESKNILEYINHADINISHMNTGPLTVPAVNSGDPWGDIGHANAGVIVFPKKSYKGFIDFLGNLEDHWEIDLNNNNFKKPNTYGGGDQQILNNYAKFLNNPLINLSYIFNFHMSRYDHDLRFTSSLIHYHGSDKNRMIMIKDFKEEKILK